jgi:hypothetical protein
VSDTPLLRPEFGPTLPDLLNRRLSISRKVITIVAVLVLVLIVVGIKVGLSIGRATVKVDGDPSFSLVYKTHQLHRAPLRPGELARVQGRTKHVFVAVTARRVALPAFRGDVVGGQLPVYATQYTDRLQAQLPQFSVSDEGKARIGTAQGYEIGYQSGPRNHRTYWREIFLISDPEKGTAQNSVVLRLRQTFSGRTNARDRALVQAGKQVYQSFRFGTSRPFFAAG